MISIIMKSKNIKLNIFYSTLLAIILAINDIERTVMFWFPDHGLRDFRDLHNTNWEVLIIVVIITWTTEKPSQNYNSDITVIWLSDWFKWVNFMQNLEHGVTVCYMMSQLASNEIQESVFCCFLFAVFK